MTIVVLRLGLSGNELAVIESVRGVRGLRHCYRKLETETSGNSHIDYTAITSQ